MKNKNVSKFVVSLVYVLLGIAILVWPDKVDNAVCYILAGSAALVGVIKITGYLLTNVEYRIEADTNGLAEGLMLLVIAVFILLKGAMIVMLIPFILGILIMYKGIEGVQNAINMKKFGYVLPKGALIVSLVIALFGLLVMINPFSSTEFLFVLLGLGLVVSGIVDIISDMIFSKKILDINKGEAEEKK